MEKTIRNPAEIVKVRAERDTMIVRLPRWFIDRHKLTSKRYLTFRDLGTGEMLVRVWEDEISGIRKSRTR